MKRISAFASAAALGVALTVSGPAFASEAPALADALRSAQNQAYPSEAFMRGGRHHGGGHVRHGGGARYVGAPRHHHYRGYRGGYYRGGRGGAVAAGVAGGLALGLLGAAIAAQQPAPGPVVVGGGSRWINYCASRFGPTFDPASGTYLGADGYRHPCR